MVRNIKHVHVITWGCQMNVYDSGRMVDALVPFGYVEVAVPEDADLIVLNTCHIRDKAAEKVFSELGRLRALKDAKAAEGGRMMLAVAGCVAQAEGSELLARAPHVDIVVGPQTYHRLPELLARASHGHGAVIDTNFPIDDKFDGIPQSRKPLGASAFLTIQEGCDKFCSFCVVPYTRGAERSRQASAILSEARALVARGVREITLLGQNVNAWHGEGAGGLGGLIRALAAIDGLARIRYSTSHPCDMDESLITAHRDVPALMPFLHLPVQSGSDRVLASMNRRHTVAQYLDLVARLRAARPDLAFSTDFIVGYPEETEADFRATLALARAVGFAQAFSFKYSARPGTPAAALPQIPEMEKARRLTELQAVLRAQQRAFNSGCVGLEVPVLFTGIGRHPGQIAGRSPWLQPVHVTGPASLIGQVRYVKVLAANSNSLTARLHAEEPTQA
jgi:tRNA-2-methylthio-N6-dimethylallyladenosine synthase